VVARPARVVKRTLQSACAWCLLLAVSGVAQQTRDPFGGPGTDTSQTPTYHARGSTLVLTIKDGSKTPMDRQSVVTLRNTLTGDTLWQVSTDRGEASFGDLSVAPYEVEVSAVGYLTTHKPVRVQNAFGSYTVEIVLERDPSSLEISAPHAAQLPKKVRKALLHGVEALKSGNYNEAEKQLDTARRLAPDNWDANFLSGYLAFQRKRWDEAQAYLRTASSLDSGNPQAFILLGRIGLEQSDYNTAQTALEQAITLDSQDWMPHNLLAETYLKQRDFERAREQAAAAIERNKVASSAAQFVLGEALANLGRTEEAIEALKTFVRQAPDSPIVPQVRDLLAELGRTTATPVRDFGVPVTDRAIMVGPDLEPAKEEPRLAAMSWQPPGIDDFRPSVAAGVACPTEEVIDMASQRVKQLADDVSRFSAVESLLHERLDATGFPTTKETRKFNYVVAIGESSPGFLEVNEYRDQRSGLADLPDHIASNGFMSLALVFHPSLRNNFQMTCEGLGDWHGQATWLVHFQQRTDRPNYFHSYVVNGSVYPVSLKGRAWIKADKFQIVRMESELVSPAPAIHLLTEHQIVEYGPVLFGKQNEELWLPQSAELYFNLRNRRYFRRHSFDHFMLFAVDSTEKRNEPKESPQTPAPSSN
jgi:tetratricopeptide (TPR) repeat protein